MIITPLSDSAEVIDITAIKEFCRLDEELDAVNESILRIQCQAALDTAEQITGLQIAERKFRVEGVGFTRDGIVTLPTIFLPITPAISVESLTILDKEGEETLINPEDYKFRPSEIEFHRPFGEISITPQSDIASITIEFTAGWTAETLPDAIRLWALNRIATANDRRTDMQESGRQTITPMPREHSERLLDRWIVYGGPNG